MTNENPLEGRPPRADREETFPPMLVDPTGPAMLGTTGPLVAALVGAHLLRLSSSTGGSRVPTAAADGAIKALERAVSPDVRAHCRDEAARIARWTQSARHTPPPPAWSDELERIEEADLQSRVSVVRWAVEQELDLQMEWYDDDLDAWPHDRVRPLAVESPDDEPALRARIGSDVRVIPVVHIRWVMPVERRPDPRVAPPEATVLPFRRPDEQE